MTLRSLLLNPGPVTLTPRVRTALSRGDWCHREAEFAALTEDILARLERVYAAEENFLAVLMTGSGTAAVEAMLTTLIAPDAVTLVVVNGVYGERMATMLRSRGRETVSVNVPWEEGIDLGALEEQLEANRQIRAVVAVHHETTTGRLNDISGLANLCERFGCELFLDTVSSFGAEEVDLAGWPVAAVAATANKCLHGAPGLSFVLMRKDVLAKVDWEVESVYLDLRRYVDVQRAGGFSPFTQAVHVAFALQEALAEHEERGGKEVRLARYREVAEHVRFSLARLGVEPLLPDADCSAVLRSYLMPAGLRYEDLHARLKADGFVIYAGQGHLRSEVFRIAHMGDIRDDDLARLSEAFKRAFGGGR